MKVEAMFYEKIKDKVHCFLCPHNCVIENGHFGKCNVRTHEDGKLFTINYGEITSISLDPIEKKPLYYFKPGSKILSVGSFGCNFVCDFCQNYDISQRKARSTFAPKEELIRIAMTTEDNIGLAFTYNEPSIWYEYMYDCAKLLKETDEKRSVVFVTNGFLSEEPLKKLLPYVDAMNIDLKSFKESYYKSLCGGRLNPVLETIKMAAKVCHVEVTTLLVSGENDNLDEIEEIAKFLASVNSEIPLHLSRYFPRYKLENPPTDVEFMQEAKKTAEKYLKRVMLGNV
ncbi:pyruvate formate lyase activating enzyme [Clostridium acetobutylicum]|uniref:Pyruvate-formate lyase-activating enzyme n=1 Tax=Clostridium acetobutylicum (strain ATCC 824 / DSM 792 / JCM 1419 / IAM 19013 / LMG 5710 / NBRC 13948 / NRRL B-527 / VKM B-1787 / 2291 / W) TaxID=272562 RepID=Q97J65_CLOAB|nr:MULTISPECIES: AmmeMemoRadiSam system radical SAM enzyme [Clostridium]AAK79389.1 Pyruvate-formate lyase-activating enzyme [Clostridium acetobutylicum ATCC 824]ADZ20474.1 Pyruvate-formate lyase-activating enzyme [Clostridium acetobutylicum EA 2018]AEI33057.1 pyruvate-formate lyase-activating enzyme [Clostridium acetobutylicum DSM 1731]AWV81362.1 AmmeMemoRadiSam system radical SAM enzyme [Clostridium acetobutylicum]MBC2392996.1 AmmeMemoRadiSam system radical SAM enzyme [Clostridium acetobutyli